MTIVYNKGQYDVSWSSPSDRDDNERTYNGRVVKRDPKHSGYWLLDGIRFTSYKNVTDYIDRQ
jgi:hypothetical protein